MERALDSGGVDVSSALGWTLGGGDVGGAVSGGVVAGGVVAGGAALGTWALVGAGAKQPE